MHIDAIIPSALAYVDPGTGSLIFQMLLGAVLGVGVALKLYWRKLRETFTRLRGGSSE